jgi:NitT/TauT family transport system substrate-binding protein
LQAGSFEAAGLKMAVKRFRNGSEVAAGIERGELDVGLSGHLQTLSSALGGSGQVFFAPLGFEESPDHLPVTIVVRADKTLSGLESGATIAMSARAAISDLQLRIFCTAEGLPYESFRIVTMPFGEMAGALQRAEIEAASVPDPFAREIVAAGVGIVVDRGTLSREMPARSRVMITGLVSTRHWIVAHRELARRLRTAVAEAVTSWAQASSVAQPKDLTEVQAPSFHTELHADDLQLAYDLAAREGIVPRRLAAEEVIMEPDPGL